MPQRRRWVELEVKGARLAVGVVITADRRARPDGWWEESTIRPADPGTELLGLLADWSRGDYELLMERVEARLVEEGA